MDLLNENIDSIDFEICEEQDTLPLEEYLQNMDLSTNNTITNDIIEDDVSNSSAEDILSIEYITRKRQWPILRCSTPKKNRLDRTVKESNSNSSETDSDAFQRNMFESADEVNMDFKTYDFEFLSTPSVLSFDNEKLN